MYLELNVDNAHTLSKAVLHALGCVATKIGLEDMMAYFQQDVMSRMNESAIVCIPKVFGLSRYGEKEGQSVFPRFPTRKRKEDNTERTLDTWRGRG